MKCVVFFLCFLMYYFWFWFSFVSVVRLLYYFLRLVILLVVVLFVVVDICFFDYCFFFFLYVSCFLFVSVMSCVRFVVLFLLFFTLHLKKDGRNPSDGCRERRKRNLSFKQLVFALLILLWPLLLLVYSFGISFCLICLPSHAFLACGSMLLQLVVSAIVFVHCVCAVCVFDGRRNTHISNSGSVQIAFEWDRQQSDIDKHRQIHDRQLESASHHISAFFLRQSA
jgi:hypothetical protein